MSPFDAAVLTERAAAIERHLARVAQRLPDTADGFEPATDRSDAVILHLWQATQIVIDLAVSLCVARGLGTPQSYAVAFRRLQTAGVIEPGLTDRLVLVATSDVMRWAVATLSFTTAGFPPDAARPQH